jgi:hypothetical protein
MSREVLPGYIRIPVRYISSDHSEEMVQDLINSGTDKEKLSFIDYLDVNINNIAAFNDNTDKSTTVLRLNNGENWDVNLPLNKFTIMLGNAILQNS